MWKNNSYFWCWTNQDYNEASYLLYRDKQINNNNKKDERIQIQWHKDSNSSTNDVCSEIPSVINVIISNEVCTKIYSAKASKIKCWKRARAHTHTHSQQNKWWKRLKSLWFRFPCELSCPINSIIHLFYTFNAFCCLSTSFFSVWLDFVYKSRLETHARTHTHTYFHSFKNRSKIFTVCWGCSGKKMEL